MQTEIMLLSLLVTVALTMGAWIAAIALQTLREEAFKQEPASEWWMASEDLQPQPILTERDHY